MLPCDGPSYEGQSFFLLPSSRRLRTSRQLPVHLFAGSSCVLQVITEGGMSETFESSF